MDVRYRSSLLYQTKDGLNASMAGPSRLIPSSVSSQRQTSSLTRFFRSTTNTTKRSGLLSAPKGDYGLWSMSQEEAEAVASFLAEKHCPLGKATPAKSPARVVRSKKTPSSSRHSAPAHSDRKTPSANPPACRGCSGRRLDPRSGKFGYYWKCADCDANTPMPTTCQACGAENPTRNDRVVTIHKKSDRYFQNCSACGIESCIWPVS